MLAKGNGLVNVCATNLVRTVRGSVPYERFKGLRIDVIDKPLSEDYRLRIAVDELLESYEPRINTRHVQVIPADLKNGGVTLKIDAA